MAQRLLTPPSSRLFQDNGLDNVIRDSELLLIDVFDKEKEHVIVDKNTSEVHHADLEQALTTVAGNISRIDKHDIGRLHDNFEDNDNSEHVSGEDGNVDQQFSFCKNCTKYKRVETHDQLKRGDSIRFPRMEGLYYHHATIKEVQNGPNSSGCTLTLIHLQKVGVPLLSKVIEEKVKYDLREDIVEKVIYKSNRFTPDEIIQRAEKYAAANSAPRTYDIKENCEDLTNEFAQGVKISHQVHSIPQRLISGLCWILNVYCEIGSRIMRIPGIDLVVSIVSLSDIIQKILHLKKFFQDKILCFCCYDKEHKKLNISLVLGLISLAVSVISHCNWSTLTIGLIINTALPVVAPYVYDYIMPLILPSFLIPKRNLGIENIPRAGDIITFDYQNLPHEGVVSYAHGLGSDTTRFKATIIPFPLPGSCGSYTVTEETIYLNKTDDVSVLDFRKTDHFQASDVVKRAKNQLGQQSRNISSHMARYCKTGNKSLTTLPTVPIRSMSDLSPGDVIRFRYYDLPHEAVVVKIAEAENIRVKVIHYNYAGMYGTREVVNEEMTFKLSDKNVHIHDYVNVEVYEPEEVVRRAKSKIGEQKFNMVSNRSSHFAQWCKIKQN